MHIFIFIIIQILISFLLLYFFKKNNFLLNLSGNKHQEFATEKKIPLIGGVIIISMILFSIFRNFNIFLIFLFAIFLVGLLSDLKKFNSPIFRLLAQFFLILICVYFLDIDLNFTRVNFLDYLLSNYLFALVFTSFCILIIVNGTNFIDGINSLVFGYYIIVSFVIFILKREGFNIDFFFPITFLIPSLILLFFLNIYNKLFLGDSGSYLLGFLFSIELINFYLNNLNISPFFIILLLWYPAFENLFSILRKINFNKSPIYPDTNHLHQLIFSFFRKKNFSVLKSNNFTGIFINLYNITVISLSMIDPYHTQLQIILIILNLSVYCFFYMRLFKYR